MAPNGGDTAAWIRSGVEGGAKPALSEVEWVTADSLPNDAGSRYAPAGGEVRKLALPDSPAQCRPVGRCFVTASTNELNSILQAMGTRGVFRAGLTGVSDDMPKTYVCSDIHKTHIEVDEKGTRAAAKTVEEATDAAYLPFVADRPFVYAIVHKPSGVIVFLGVCADPTQNSASR